MRGHQIPVEAASQDVVSEANRAAGRGIEVVCGTGILPVTDRRDARPTKIVGSPYQIVGRAVPAVGPA